MNPAPGAKLEYRVSARRIDAHGSKARAKDAVLVLDTDVAGRTDAFNPAELLLASLAACLVKGAERVAPMINFKFEGMEIHIHGVRQDAPPKMTRIEYEIVVDTEESERRLELLHANMRKFGTVSNTLADTLELKGTIRHQTR